MILSVESKNKQRFCCITVAYRCVCVHVSGVGTRRGWVGIYPSEKILWEQEYLFAPSPSTWNVILHKVQKMVEELRERQMTNLCL